MDFRALVDAALNMGVIPALALFLAFAMYLQNRKLTSMLEDQEKSTMEMLQFLIKEVMKSVNISQVSQVNDNGTD